MPYQNRNKRHYCESKILVEEIGKEVLFYGHASYVDVGIGHYECHGYVGNDVDWQLECEDIFWDKKEFSEQENESIEKYLDENKNYESVVDKFEKTIIEKEIINDIDND